MRILPVLDLLDGCVVRGVAGRRDQYRPIQSRLASGSDPLAIATAIRSQFGLTQFYVADLDAIVHGRPNLTQLNRLRDQRFSLMVDAGIRRSADAEVILAAGADQLVAGLETLHGPAELADLIQQHGTDRVVFSLDLRDGQPLNSSTGWPSNDPFSIAKDAIERDFTQLIVLDISHVGTHSGVPTLELCQRLRVAFPSIKIITGGGVRGPTDLQALDQIGIDGVLIASALHDGSIQPSDIAAFV